MVDVSARQISGGVWPALGTRIRPSAAVGDEERQEDAIVHPLGEVAVQYGHDSAHPRGPSVAQPGCAVAVTRPPAVPVTSHEGGHALVRTVVVPACSARYHRTGRSRRSPGLGMSPDWISAAIDFQPELLQGVQIELGVLQRDRDVLGESVEEREILGDEVPVAALESTYSAPRGSTADAGPSGAEEPAPPARGERGTRSPREVRSRRSCRGPAPRPPSAASSRAARPSRPRASRRTSVSRPCRVGAARPTSSATRTTWLPARSSMRTRIRAPRPSPRSSCPPRNRGGTEVAREGETRAIVSSSNSSERRPRRCPRGGTCRGHGRCRRARRETIGPGPHARGPGSSRPWSRVASRRPAQVYQSLTTTSHEPSSAL